MLSIFNWTSLFSNKSWFTLSKALERLRRTSKKISPLSIDLKIWSITFTSACSVELLLRYAYWLSCLINYYFLSIPLIELIWLFPIFLIGLKVNYWSENIWFFNITWFMDWYYNRVLLRFWKNLCDYRCIDN